MSRAELPVRFADWPREDQAELIARDNLRFALIARCCRLSHYPVDQRELDSNSFVTKKMLAAIYCQLRGYNHDDT